MLNPLIPSGYQLMRHREALAPRAVQPRTLSYRNFSPRRRSTAAARELPDAFQPPQPSFRGLLD